jgi:spatacsin
MSYVFELLKEHDQFEYLLRKGMDRLPLLRQALLDFLRPNCLENRELFRLVALHFHMHAEVAGMWQDEANGLLKPVIDLAFRSILKTNKKPIGSPLPKTVDSSPVKKSISNWSLEATVATSTTTILPMLKAGPEIKKVLTSAMHNLAHAAEYFLQVSIESVLDC